MSKLIITPKHQSFLIENRQDPITGDKFELGDELVFCAACKSAFHIDSWKYIGERHCEQTSTLKQFPTTQKLYLARPVRYEFSQPIWYKRLFAFGIDLGIAISIMLFFSLSNRGDLVTFAFGVLFSCIYLVFRDLILKNKSIGKAIFGLQFVHKITQIPVTHSDVAFRNLINWFLNIMIIVVAAVISVSLENEYVFALLFAIQALLNAFQVYLTYIKNTNSIDSYQKIVLLHKRKV